MLNQKRKNKIINKIIISIIFIIIIIFSFLIDVSSKWARTSFGEIDFNKILFLLSSPLKGTGKEIVYSYIKTCIPITLIISISLIILIPLITNFKSIIKITIKNHDINFNITPFKRRLLITMIILIFSINYSLNNIDFYIYLKNQTTDSDFIMNNYVDPLTTKITFNKKNNLIYIFLESMEYTFEEDNIISELTKLRTENVSFNSNKGAYTLGSSTWTIAAMVAQTSGIPLNTSIDGNSFDKYDFFLPGASSIGEILEHNGYTNYLLVGSNSEFGGRKKYFTQHGHYNIWDWNSAIINNDKKEDEYVFWGFDDTDLFKYAKRDLDNIDKTEPFNYTLLTVNTHHPDGYLEEDCPKTYDMQYKNVLSCSSRQVYDFVNWIKEQSWYQNTTIVIVGDHLSMNESYFTKIDKNYQRTVYTTIINPVISYEMGEREFTTYDLYPTTLRAIGANIKGDKLGLGTDLFSQTKTLVEEYGISYVNEELNKKSTFYNKKFKNYE